MTDLDAFLIDGVWTTEAGAVESLRAVYRKWPVALGLAAMAVYGAISLLAWLSGQPWWI